MTEEIVGTQVNKVKLAIQKIGGPTMASNSMLVSNATIHAWVKKGRISNLNQAKKMSKLSGVPVEELRPCDGL